MTNRQSPKQVTNEDLQGQLNSIQHARQIHETRTKKIEGAIFNDNGENRVRRIEEAIFRADGSTVFDEMLFTFRASKSAATVIKWLVSVAAAFAGIAVAWHKFFR